eukprot:286700-Rhodomonas_salina.3
MQARAETGGRITGKWWWRRWTRLPTVAMEVGSARSARRSNCSVPSSTRHAARERPTRNATRSRHQRSSQEVCVSAAQPTQR